MAITYDSLIAYINGLHADGTMTDADFNQTILYILANGNLENSPRDLIQIRRGNFANLPNLAIGEPGLCLDTEQFYIGGETGNIPIPSNSDIMPLYMYKDKRICFEGDSIIYGQLPVGHAANTIPKVFGDLTKSVVINNGDSGTSYAVGNGFGWKPAMDARAFCNRCETVDYSSFDYLFVMFGINDYGFNIELGYDTDTLKTTTKGALNHSFDYLTSHYPNLKICIITPIYAPTQFTPNGRGYTVMDYVTAIKKIASNWGLPVIDAFTAAGINANNYSTLYWDALHPTALTYERLGAFIANAKPDISAQTPSTVKELLTTEGGYNLVRYDSFTIEKEHGVMAQKIHENGNTLRVNIGAVKTSKSFINVVPGEVLYISFYANSKNAGNYFEVDLFNAGGASKLCMFSRISKVGDFFYTGKLVIPATADVNTLYQLRFATDVNATNVMFFSSIIMTRGNMPQTWKPAPGENSKKIWTPITLDATAKSGIAYPAPSFYVDGDGFMHFAGIVTTTSGLIGTIPDANIIYYSGVGLTTSIVANDGSITFLNINTAGSISTGIANKKYDLASVPPYFVGYEDSL